MSAVFSRRPWERNECVTNEPQRTSAGRLDQYAPDAQSYQGFPGASYDVSYFVSAEVNWKTKWRIFLSKRRCFNFFKHLNLHKAQAVYFLTKKRKSVSRMDSLYQETNR